MASPAPLLHCSPRILSLRCSSSSSSASHSNLNSNCCNNSINNCNFNINNRITSSLSSSSSSSSSNSCSSSRSCSASSSSSGDYQRGHHWNLIGFSGKLILVFLVYFSFVISCLFLVLVLQFWNWFRFITFLGTLKLDYARFGILVVKIFENENLLLKGVILELLLCRFSGNECFALIFFLSGGNLHINIMEQRSAIIYANRAICSSSSIDEFC